MPFFDPNRQPPEVDPRDQVAIVREFLLRCKAWAEQNEIPSRQLKLAQHPDPEAAAKLQAWVGYLQFTEHTIHELEAGTLDHWFGENQTE